MMSIADRPAKAAKRTHASYIPEFDGLRGLSILLVILYHCWNYSGTAIAAQVVYGIANFGWAGVDVFFVLSGFLITGILLDTRNTRHYWRNFFIRRGLRIFPLYYAVLLFLLVDYWSITHYGIGIKDKSLVQIDRIWINFLYLTNFAMAFHGSNYVCMSIAWSLAIEEQFYLLYPILVLGVEKKSLAKILIVGILLAPCLRVLFFSLGPEPGTAPYVLPFCRMDDLALGGLAQIAIRNLTLTQLKRINNFTPLLSALAILSLLTWDRADLIFVLFGYSLTGLASASLLVTVLTSERAALVRKLFANRVLVYIGKLSYGLYLLHLMARAAVDRLLMSRLPPNALQHVGYSAFRLLAIIALAILMATISYYLFELPILRLKNRLAQVKERFHSPG